MLMTIPKTGTVPAKFLIDQGAQGRVHSIQRGAPITAMHIGCILLVRGWDPSQVLNFRVAVAVIVLARSTRSHATVAALQLCKPSCIVDPDTWPAFLPAWAELRPEEGEVFWMTDRQ